MRLLGMPQTHWTPVDCILWVKMMAFGLAANWEQELLRGQLAATEPEALLSWGGMTAPAGYPEVCGSLTRERLEEVRQEWARVQDCLPAGLTSNGPGSNAWAVSGKLSATGRPLLASDPHLAPKYPDSWYQAELIWPGGHLIGATMAGFPGVVIGQNQSLAWGATNSYIDVQDLFWERIDRGRDHAGETLGERWEEIGVRFFGRRKVQVLTTARGPLLTPPRAGYALSLAWSGAVPGEFFRGLLGLNRAADLEQARQAMVHWPAPSLCYVLADLHNIGYQAVGNIPRRPPGSGLVPVPAWDPRFAWQGMLSFAEHPALTNPKQGFVVCANHGLGPDLSWDFNCGLRAQRVEQLLRSRSVHDWRSLAAIQGDIVSLLACRFRDLCAQIPDEPVLASLKDWDGCMAAQSREACLYAATMICLAERVLPPAWRGLYIGPATHHPLLRQGGHLSRLQPWILNWLEADVNRLEHLREAAREAARRLHRRLGPAHRWQWGRLHGLRLPWGWWTPLGGDSDTPNQSGYLCQRGLPGSLCLIASYRMIAEVGNPGAYRSNHFPGQSGLWLNPHFADGVKDWVHGVYQFVSQTKSS
jgi:penicillin amidase